MRKRLFISLGLCMLPWAMASAQNTFTSGSTGTDGAFAPTQNTTIQVPASGAFNYTTVNIPAGVTITYIRNAANTPVTILATGDVEIDGAISVNGQPGNGAGFAGLSGPGGYSGGNGGVIFSNGTTGDGPGGGAPGIDTPNSSCSTGGSGGGYQTSGFANTTTGQGGSIYGSRLLIPLIGGSGGGGGCGQSPGNSGAGGGGGGGAIFVASSTQIIFSATSGSTGAISANGGDGGGFTNYGSAGGGGSGGAIHLSANTIKGTAQLTASGGRYGFSYGGYGGSGGNGYIRVEAFDLTALSPTNSSPMSSGLPNSVAQANIPGLQIVSIAGVAAPPNPSGSFEGSPDIILPANQTSPVTVVVNGSNIPAGTLIKVVATTASGAQTSANGTLSGTNSASSVTTSIAVSPGLSVLTASAVIDLAQTGRLHPFYMNGEAVEKIEVAAQYGGGSDVTYVTHSGRRIRLFR